MSHPSVPFFYDEQIRRFLLQFIRLFSNFQVQFGKDNLGNTVLRSVPARYGDASRQAAQVLTNNSENFLPVVPSISCYINGLKYDRERVQEPNFVSKMSIREREWDEDLQEYKMTQGNAFTIERLMPVPYSLNMKVDVWTSNTEQKLQLLEQILCLFNPSLEIQSTDNYIDWTSLSLVELTDVNWSSRSVPIGTENPIDIATLTFTVPIWISAPAKIKKLGVVQKIIGGIFDAQGNLDTNNIDDWLLIGDRPYITPLNFGVILNSNQLILLRYDDITTNDAINDYPLTKLGTPENWRAFSNIYGKLIDGISQVKLLQSDGETEVVGTVAFHPTDDTILIFTVDTDTIPDTTLTDVNAIIDPQTSGPGGILPAAASGQRYLLTNDIGHDDNSAGALAWRGTNSADLVANTNDIVEYDGTEWSVSFDASETLTLEYVRNAATGVEYKWTGSNWVRSYEGEYKGGRWTLII